MTTGGPEPTTSDTTASSSSETTTSVDPDTSGGSESSSSTGLEVVCGDGMPDADGVCLVEGASFSVAGGPVDVVYGDFDGDAVLDIVTANFDGDTIAFLRGDGAGGFDTPSYVALAPDAEPLSLAAGPLSADGFDDVLVANGGLGSVSILHGGTEGFTIQTISTNGTPGDVAIANLDGSGGLDFAVVNTQHEVFSTWVAQANGNYLLADVNDGGPIPFIDAFALGEVAVPGPIDVVFSGDLVVGASPGAGNGSIEETVIIVADIVAPVLRMSGGDVNGDGELDVALATEGAVEILVGDGNPNAAMFDETLLGVHDMVVDAVIADVTGEGNHDVVAVSRGDSELVVYPGNGDGTFGAAVTLPIGTAASAVLAADFDGDGHKEVLVVDQVAGTVTVFSGNP